MIDCFEGEYRFLSNFHPSVIVYEGTIYPTVEQAYQAAKTTNIEEREVIRLMERPGQAKRYGARVALRPDWEWVKVRIMAELVFQKFVAHGDLGGLLVATDPQPLCEGNDWGDYFWGMCNGRGHNVLGRILVHVRSLLITIRQFETTQVAQPEPKAGS